MWNKKRYCKVCDKEIGYYDRDDHILSRTMHIKNIYEKKREYIPSLEEYCLKKDASWQPPETFSKKKKVKITKTSADQIKLIQKMVALGLSFLQIQDLGSFLKKELALNGP